MLTFCEFLAWFALDLWFICSNTANMAINFWLASLSLCSIVIMTAAPLVIRLVVSCVSPSLEAHLHRVLTVDALNELLSFLTEADYRITPIAQMLIVIRLQQYYGREVIISDQGSAAQVVLVPSDRYIWEMHSNGDVIPLVPEEYVLRYSNYVPPGYQRCVVPSSIAASWSDEPVERKMEFLGFIGHLMSCHDPCFAIITPTAARLICRIVGTARAMSSYGLREAIVCSVTIGDLGRITDSGRRNEEIRWIYARLCDYAAQRTDFALFTDKHSGTRWYTVINRACIMMIPEAIAARNALGNVLCNDLRSVASGGPIPDSVNHLSNFPFVDDALRGLSDRELGQVIARLRRSRMEKVARYLSAKRARLALV